MASTQFVDVSSGMILAKYGGHKGLVYYGLRLATLTSEELNEYLDLKKQELNLDLKVGNIQRMNPLKQMGVISGKPQKVPQNLSVRYEKVKARLTELEKIMDEKTINKEEFLKRLYL